mmetsp:Transcript_45336/g.73853  ORF Transcript_45336/g.73853 Transcript_45336/m.73853 type:complete len:108 (-) Transcript_45336:2654-2977(-)
MQQKISHCKVFHPTAAEFNDFETYIATVDQSAGRDGIAKIVPPEDWRPHCRAWKSMDSVPWNLMLKSPIRQHAEGANGIYTVWISVAFLSLQYSLMSSEYSPSPSFK